MIYVRRINEDKLGVRGDNINTNIVVGLHTNKIPNLDKMAEDAGYSNDLNSYFENLDDDFNWYSFCTFTYEKNTTIAGVQLANSIFSPVLELTDEFIESLPNKIKEAKEKFKKKFNTEAKVYIVSNETF